MTTQHTITSAPLTGEATTADLLAWRRLSLEHESGWARDEWHSGVRHPRMVLNMYADNDRDDEGNPLALNAHTRALAVFELFPTVMVR